jgi:hypothetical protein
MAIRRLRSKRRRERTVYFPWERRGLRALSPGRRLRSWLVVALVALALVAMRRRDRLDRDLRVTRATLRHVHEAIDAYRRDHDGACPRGLAELGDREQKRVYLQLSAQDRSAGGPRDAWNRPLRYACPGHAESGYDLLSDGPDGEPYGLDRVE